MAFFITCYRIVLLSFFIFLKTILKQCSFLFILPLGLFDRINNVKPCSTCSDSTLETLWKPSCQRQKIVGGHNSLFIQPRKGIDTDLLQDYIIFDYSNLFKILFNVLYSNDSGVVVKHFGFFIFVNDHFLIFWYNDWKGTVLILITSYEPFLFPTEGLRYKMLLQGIPAQDLHCHFLSFFRTFLTRS